MNWAWANNDALLIVIRALHFAATAVTAGALIFRAAVADPAARHAGWTSASRAPSARRVASIGLAIAVTSGVIWVVLLTMRMSGLSLRDALSADGLGTVIGETQFGQASAVRLLCALILAVCLAFDRMALLRWGALVAALGLVAGLAWTGHAGSTPDPLGEVHLAADILHLGAASAWIGGLFLLAGLLVAGRRQPAPAWRAYQLDGIRRFSILGMVSVATLTLSGLVSSWLLVGSWRGLVVTDYGLLLSVKLVLFAVMLAFAAINRLWWTPRLASAAPGQPGSTAVRRLTRNTMIELALGLMVFAIVGALGIQHPAIHLAQ
jgi:putative copper resistance protein D